jgi:hypothetical protein
VVVTNLPEEVTKCCCAHVTFSSEEVTKTGVAVTLLSEENIAVFTQTRQITTAFFNSLSHLLIKFSSRLFLRYLYSNNQYYNI